MACLIPEILFAIGKKLVEDGDSNELFKFMLSGKEQFYAMKNVFASIQSIEFYKNYYVIGWKNPCCTLQLHDDLPLSKFMMNYIGNSVIDLRMKCFFPTSLEVVYGQIIENIMAANQLISFSMDDICNPSFLETFLPHFSSTLKNVSIPSDLLSPTFRDSLNLDSLISIDKFGDRLPLFCCKTKSITFTHEDAFPQRRFDIYIPGTLSPALSSVKELVFEEDQFYQVELIDIVRQIRNLCIRFREIMKYFPSLELIKFCLPIPNIFIVHNYIRFYIKLINTTARIPPKIVLKFHEFRRNVVLLHFDDYKRLTQGFDYDESTKEFYCFRKWILCAHPKNIVLEIQFPL